MVSLDAIDRWLPLLVRGSISRLKHGRDRTWLIAFPAGTKVKPSDTQAVFLRLTPRWKKFPQKMGATFHHMFTSNRALAEKSSSRNGTSDI